MKLFKEKEFFEDYARAIRCEWLETNGLGGYASSTLTGCNTRRYHGLLTAAVTPPAERMLLLSKLDETIVSGGLRFELGCNNYGDVISPEGYRYLTSFTKNLYPEFLYDTGDVQLKKRIIMPHGENTTLIEYEVIKTGSPIKLELTPLIAARNYHSLRSEINVPEQATAFSSGTLSQRMDDIDQEVFIHIDNAVFRHAPAWYRNFEYTEEKERGLDCHEDLFSPGTLSVQLEQGHKIIVIISSKRPADYNAAGILEAEIKRRATIAAPGQKQEVIRQLLLAADQFIVQKDADLKTVIAGYHWFADWCRDTMIALPGLCLVTKRLEDAEKILLAFARYVNNGMLPNRFPDQAGQEPEYNNADGTLWYFIAVKRYLDAGGNKKFIWKNILPVLSDIIHWHYSGTRYGIHVTDDQLLSAGEDGIQLTWMDAKAGDWVVTPRQGKAVEINALWYNALRIYAKLLKQSGARAEAKIFRAKAKITKKNFLAAFSNTSQQHLNDVVNGQATDSSLRPNQLFALALCYPLIKKEKAKKILEVVQAKLLTRYGLRSLSPDDVHYAGRYEGDVLQRDGAYHQGTVWSWLTGIYIDALFNCYGKDAKPAAQQAINQLVEQLNEAGIGSVSEIFDGDEPHTLRGCIAQAWSVAELLRVIFEYELFAFPDA
ncbi:MAG: glycogen debranching enzyme N-terminal domain-containing protein [Chitinophagales bacterium]|nr:glycogen debranching enzyme N-terminal domain-containing protein [Chitinophagales bacterium]